MADREKHTSSLQCRASRNSKKNFKVDASLTQFMEEKFVGENLTFEKGKI